MSGSSSGGSGRKGKQSSGRGQNRLKQRVKSARGRKISSTRWLQRQLNDPYVAEAKEKGYRSRAAFKLLQLDEKAGLLKKGQKVVDLGAAPGGWIQVALEKLGPSGKVIGIDLQEIETIAGAELLQMDFMDDEAPLALKRLLDGPADLVLSDMAAAATGHPQTDHLRIMALAEAALEFAEEVLAPGGGFAAKMLQGGSEKELLDRLKKRFEKVRHIKPPASRSDSAELYVVATGFRGRDEG